MVACLLFNFSTLSALRKVTSLSNLGHVLEMAVLQRVLACCGHIPKHANNTMRGRLWCVSRNAAAGKSTARQCISIDTDDLMFSLL